ncbi:AAA family ATPase [Fodinibius halophilus]|uniref:ATP-binding protein n=1 Tax=Fodinibius halophilus TaxID=1736908 RepID=A0A6M1SU28_9BACT|nr:AAA family ATPase [Fodinibius halophilus]NGP87458.1 ATP-binding protein [Fodinibius halophilus]
MELISFRIFNFKSIIDSGECYLSRDLTILAGKNESGKSNVLEALECFNVDKEFSEDHIPVHKDGEPRIELTLRIGHEELPTFKVTEEIKELSKNELELTLTKDFSSNYFLDEEFLRQIGLLEIKKARYKVREDIEKKTSEINILHDENVSRQAEVKLPEVIYNNLEDSIKRFKQYTNQLNNNSHVSNVNTLTQEVNELISLLKINKNDNDDLRYATELAHYVPYFVLFKSFDDILPNEIEIDNLSNSKWIKAFEKISDIDTSLIKSGGNLQKVNHKKRLNIEFNEELQKYWKQDQSEVLIEWDSDTVLFFISEENEHFKPSMRSKGKQWYLSFYILVSAKTKEEYDNIILIDEPGLYLHAKAQKDIIKRLNDLPSQILFSTHSPYLISNDRLHRVRAVLKENNNTTISNKLHKVSDKETLTPVLTTIGLGINDGISNVDKINNIIVEGPSDYYYLNAFMKIMNENSVNIIHGGGATNMPHVGTILQGWGCDIYYLFDNDNGYKEAKKKLDKDWECTTKDMIGKIPLANAAIEDVLSKDLYHSAILETGKYDKRKKNSTIAKKTDKVLNAKLFYEKVLNGGIDIDDESKENIKKLIDILRKKF